jgi:hypothetical protein
VRRLAVHHAPAAREEARDAHPAHAAHALGQKLVNATTRPLFFDAEL